MVGFFEDTDGIPWAMIVNRRHAKQASAIGKTSLFQVFPDKRVKRIVEIYRATGEEREIDFSQGNFMLELPGGTGSLIRLETED